MIQKTNEYASVAPTSIGGSGTDITLADVEISLLKLDREIETLEGRISILGARIPGLKTMPLKPIAAATVLDIKPLITAIIFMGLWFLLMALLQPWIELKITLYAYTVLKYLGLIIAFCYYPLSVSKRMLEVRDAQAVLNAAIQLRDRLNERFSKMEKNQQSKNYPAQPVAS